MTHLTTKELFAGATGLWIVVFVIASLQESYSHAVPLPVIGATVVVAVVFSVFVFISDHTARTYGVDD